MDKTPRDPLDLESILSEFSPTGEEEPTPAVEAEEPTPVPEAPSAQAPEEPEPKAPPRAAEPRHKRREKPEKKPEKAPAEPPKADTPKEDKTPWWKRKPEAVHLSEKVIQFPEEDGSVTRRIGKLMEKADEYAEGMFRGDEEPDPERERRERLLPGVDWEEEPTHAPAPRRRRVARHPKPDLHPGQLAQRYKRGMGFLRLRAFLSALWCLPQLYLMLAADLHLPLGSMLSGDPALLYRASAVCLGFSALLALDVLAHGLSCLIRLRLESETVLLFAVCACVGDALTMPLLGDREGAMPYCAVVALALFFALWGRLLKRKALRTACRTAAGAAEPYLVTLEERLWAGTDAYTKWSGKAEGYGSQIQEPDGVQRAYHICAPLILICAGLFSLLASVGRQRPELFFWCLSATLTAGCGFTAFLSFSMPFSDLSRRLSKVGAALGGWDAMSWSGRDRGVVLTDGDLFPPGSVTLNGIKIIGDISLETAASYAATLVRETGSGMEKPFSDMLRSQGGLYRKVSQVVIHEGGVTGVIAGQAVCVGSGAFMEIEGVALPQGLRVKNAVFCAVDGKLCAIFALNYSLHTAIRPAIESLIANGLKPILATRDFLIIPEMLRQRFKLPADRMEFPNLDRRRELSARRLEHERTLTAVLCREGLGPYADAVVGSKRLLGATRAGLAFDLLGAAVGLVMAFYLCLSQAYASLSAGTMLAFLLLWLVPTVLISGWVNRY